MGSCGQADAAGINCGTGKFDEKDDLTNVPLPVLLFPFPVTTFPIPFLPI
jgi:hypothetical protein